MELNLVGVTGQNRIPYLNDHRVDLLMSVGYSDERAEVIDFAAAYAPYYIAVIGPAALEVAGPDDLAEKTIAVNRGTLEDTSLTEAAPETAEIKRFDNYNAVIQAFISGQTELMVVGNDVGAQVLARQEALQPEQKFQLLTSPSHIGLNKDEERAQDRRQRRGRDDAGRRQAQRKLGGLAESAARSREPQGLSLVQPRFGWLNDALGAILSGSAMTLLLIAVTTLLGTVISILLAAGRRSGSRLLRSVITGYVELVRNTPFLVQLFFIYFGLPSLGIRLDPFAAAILAMTLNMAAYTTEIVGAGLDAVPKGQKEAASALGLHPVQVFMKIVLPQALKVIYPGPHQPDRHHDARIRRRVADRRARPDLRGRHDPGAHVPRLRDLSRGDAGLSRDFPSGCGGCSSGSGSARYR